MPHLSTITEAHQGHHTVAELPGAPGHKPSGTFTKCMLFNCPATKSLIFPENVFMYLVKELVFPFPFPCYGVCVCVCVRACTSTPAKNHAK